jgi:hypothetical protein
MQSIKERYELLEQKIQAIRDNLHLISNEELELSVKTIEEYEAIIRQIEDLYSDQL